MELPVREGLVAILLVKVYPKNGCIVHRSWLVGEMVKSLGLVALTHAVGDCGPVSNHAFGKPAGGRARPVLPFSPERKYDAEL
jgi:hypothetical protein